MTFAAFLLNLDVGISSVCGHVAMVPVYAKYHVLLSTGIANKP